MNDLSAVRVNRTTRAFVHIGIDYASIAERTILGRGHKSQKAYIALFVCLTIKTLHLEFVSDYTSPTFISVSTFQFVSCRGLLSSIYSDNGITFHGTDRELYPMYIQKPYAILIFETDSLSTELRGTSYPLRRRTSAA